MELLNNGLVKSRGPLHVTNQFQAQQKFVAEWPMLKPLTEHNKH